MLLLRPIGRTPSGLPADFGSTLRIRVLTSAIVKIGSIGSIGSFWGLSGMMLLSV